MRLALCLALFANPAAAWEFSATPVCTLTGPGTRLTYDGTYTITITDPAGWNEAPVFAIRFDGPRGLTISTDRHVIAGETVSVSDTGFGNVLDGLQFNQTATAILGAQQVTIPLDGAAEPTAAFRDCRPAPATS